MAKAKASFQYVWFHLICSVFCGLGLKAFALPSPEPLSVAAEYYYSRHDYRQALKLWSEVFSRSPESVSAMLRVAELKLFYEGRIASRDTVLGFLQSVNTLDPSTRRDLQNRLGVLQSLFLSDDAQSIFLQAKTKMQYKDFNGALALLNQALNVEKGNLAILKEKAKGERALTLYDKSYASLKTALESDPFDGEVLELLIEAQYFFKDYKDLVGLIKKLNYDSLSARTRTAYALAMLELGNDAEALTVFSALVGGHSNNLVLAPAVWYGMGKLLLKQDVNSAVGMQYIERFVGLMAQADSGLVAGWDSFRSREKADEAVLLVARWKEASKNSGKSGSDS